MLVLNNQDLHAYLFGHAKPKSSGHKKYNVISNVSIESTKKRTWGHNTEPSRHVVDISCGNEQC